MKYRKKPIVIEAYQTDVELDVETLEGVMHASVGDYIITGINGERYPCKPNIFEKTYELVEENNYKTNKELTSLRAFKLIKDITYDRTDLYGIEVYREALDIIETALKENEYLKTELLGQSQELNIKNKVLAIIKEKPQTLFLVQTCENYDTYLEIAQDSFLIENIYLPKEYDLLKEVLV